MAPCVTPHVTSLSSTIINNRLVSVCEITHIDLEDYFGYFRHDYVGYLRDFYTPVMNRIKTCL